MPNSGWIKFHRKMLEHPLWKDKTALFVFTWLLIRCDYKTGQVTTGKYVGSQDCGMAPTTFYDALKRLEKKYDVIKMSTTKATIKFTTIAINNWHKYQQPDHPTDFQPTIDRLSTDTIQEDKKIRNKEVVADINSNKRKLLLLLNDKEYLKEKSNQFNIDQWRVVEEIRLCADWWEESRKQLKHAKSAANNWLKKVSPLSDTAIHKNRVREENRITDVPILSAEQRKKNIKQMEGIKKNYSDKFLS